MIDTLIVLCTAHFFFALFYKPQLFDGLNRRWPVSGFLALLGCSLYRVGVGVGLAGILYLGMREFIHDVTDIYLRGWADTALGLTGLALAFFAIKRFTAIGVVLAGADSSKLS